MADPEQELDAWRRAFAQRLDDYLVGRRIKRYELARLIAVNSSTASRIFIEPERISDRVLASVAKALPDFDHRLSEYAALRDRALFPDGSSARWEDKQAAKDARATKNLARELAAVAQKLLALAKRLDS